ncbi:MAG: DUF736 family protein [Candidatus Anstonellales archaeon]
MRKDLEVFFMGNTPEKFQKKPDFRIIQPSLDETGRTIYKDIGAMWKNVSKNGNDFYTLKIGRLKLLVFPNTLEQSHKPSTNPSLEKIINESFEMIAKLPVEDKKLEGCPLEDKANAK